MRHFHPLTVAFALLSATLSGRAESTASETRELIVVAGPHIKITWSVPEAKLQDTGVWDTHREPRLSITQAVATARSHLKALGSSDRLVLISIELRQPYKFDTPNEFYFYFIHFDEPGSFDPETARDVVVLLDGSVVEPVRTKS